MHCPADQKDNICEMQELFAALKASARKLMKTTKASGDGRAYQAAYAVKVAIEQAHVVAGEKLCDCYEDGGEIVIQGPGRG